MNLTRFLLNTIFFSTVFIGNIYSQYSSFEKDSLLNLVIVEMGYSDIYSDVLIETLPYSINKYSSSSKWRDKASLNNRVKDNVPYLINSLKYTLSRKMSLSEIRGNLLALKIPILKEFLDFNTRFTTRQYLQGNNIIFTCDLLEREFQKEYHYYTEEKLKQLSRYLEISQIQDMCSGMNEMLNEVNDTLDKWIRKTF